MYSTSAEDVLYVFGIRTTYREFVMCNSLEYQYEFTFEFHAMHTCEIEEVISTAFFKLPSFLLADF